MRIALACLLVGCAFEHGRVPMDARDVDAPVDTPTYERVTDGLVGFWSFGDGSGSVVRDSIAKASPFVPMDLTISDTTAVSWVSDPSGLRFDQPALVASAANAYVNRAVSVTTGEVTVEAWATSASTNQGAGMVGTLANYAVVVSLSPSYAYRNAMIAQVGDRWTGRVWTSAGTSNGLPIIETAAGSVELDPTHLVVVASPTRRVLYVDGKPFTSTPDGVGQVQGVWNVHFPVNTGNELGTARPWLGTIWLLAAYDRALSEAEVQQNFMAGPDCDQC